MKTKNIRLEKVLISNYKGIGELEIEFPDGLVATDPDVNIFGSMNGVGKTSVLECCAWALLAISVRSDLISKAECDFSGLVKSGASEARVTGYFSGCKGAGLHRVSITFEAKGGVRTTGFVKNKWPESEGRLETLVERVLGRASEPAHGRSFFFLHSYRKVREGRPELGMILDDDVRLDYHQRRHYIYRYAPIEVSFSAFKRLIVKHLMQNANLFEDSSLSRVHQDDVSISVLNGLLSQYAEVRVGKLKPYANNTIDVMVEKISDPENSFSIDGLSSGQKEIISTLFLIWNATREKPCTVLIDEPELHLNEQWHAGFVKKLVELAPHNQYVLATHAKAIMESVRGRNRHLLVGDFGEGDRPQ